MQDRGAEHPYYYSDEVTALLDVLSEATRPTPRGGPAIYIPPPGGDKARANYHHFLFGPRGSGKTSLLRHLEATIEREGRAAIWIDQEVYAALSYPDVLVSAVLEVMRGLGAAVNARREKVLAERSRVFRRLPRAASKQARELETLHGLLLAASANLDALKFAPNDREILWSRKIGTQSSQAISAETLGTITVARASAAATAEESASKEVQATETIKVAKEDYLERSLQNFRALVRDAVAAVNGGFLFVDDFYMLAKDDQPRVLGYLHRLIKDTGLWLKLGSVRYFTKTYQAGDPPRGMQSGHDALEIALDRGMRLHSATKTFMESILTELAKRAGVNLKELLTDGAKERLMLASGGVARDYLRLVAAAIDQARNRGPSRKVGTERIIAEDINTAAGEFFSSKLDAMHQDAPELAQELTRLLVDLTEFCRSTKRAYFLVAVEDRELTNSIEALQHLRFAHLLHTSETVPDRGSERFNLWLLDVGQLAAQRATQGMDFDGWKKREARRNRRIIYSSDRDTIPAASPDNRDARGRFKRRRGPDSNAVAADQDSFFDVLEDNPSRTGDDPTSYG